MRSPGPKGSPCGITSRPTVMARTKSLLGSKWCADRLRPVGMYHRPLTNGEVLPWLAGILSARCGGETDL
jgi:hypothetical protein